MSPLQTKWFNFWAAVKACFPVVRIADRNRISNLDSDCQADPPQEGPPDTVTWTNWNEFWIATSNQFDPSRPEAATDSNLISTLQSSCNANPPQEGPPDTISW